MNHINCHRTRSSAIDTSTVDKSFSSIEHGSVNVSGNCHSSSIECRNVDGSVFSPPVTELLTFLVVKIGIFIIFYPCECGVCPTSIFCVVVRERTSTLVERSNVSDRIVFTIRILHSENVINVVRCPESSIYCTSFPSSSVVVRYINTSRENSLESSCVFSISCNGDLTRIFCVTIVPSYEFVTFVSNSCKSNYAVNVISTTTIDSTHCSVVSVSCNCVLFVRTSGEQHCTCEECHND